MTSHSMTVILTDGTVQRWPLKQKPTKANIKTAIAGDYELIKISYDGQKAYMFISSDAKERNMKVNAIATQLYLESHEYGKFPIFGDVVIITGYKY